MKRVRLLRERLYKTKEWEIDPEEPDKIISDGEVFGNESDEGFWNEYYRVGIIDTDDEYTIQDEMFQDTCEDFYSYKDAYNRYKEMEKELENETR